MSINDPVNMYYDLDLVNTDFSENGQIPARLTFTEVRASPILMNPQDYFFSIVRFQLDTAGSMPLFIPQIDLKQEPNQFLPVPPSPPPPAPPLPNPNWSPDFPNKTVYDITINYWDKTTGTVAKITKPVIYKPHFTVQVNNNIQSPPTTAPLTLEAITSNYYWVGSYAWWIQMLNETIAEIWNDFVALIPLAERNALPDFQVLNPPFLRWDDTINSATFVAPYSLFNQTGEWNPYVPLAPPAPDPKGEFSPAIFNIFFNTPLHTLFSSFEYVFNNFVNPGKTNYMLRIYNKNGTNWEPTPAVVPPAPSQNWNALFTKQLYGTGSTMCPISSLIFETSLMPIVPQMIGLPKIFSSATSLGTQAITGGQNNNLSNEITDIVEPLNRGDEYFPNVLYLPQAEYRLIDLQGNGPVSSIQISVKWKDIYGIYHDFFLQNGCGASMKILFRQKAFNNISSS
jgi:hypothetical protein